MAAIGLLLARYLPTDVRTLSRVTLYALTPSLLFNLLVTSEISASEFGRIARRFSQHETCNTQYEIRSAFHASIRNRKSKIQNPMALLSIFANNILPILLVAAVGFLLARYLHTDAKTLSRVTLYALTPSLVFNLLVTSEISANEFGRIALFATCTVLGIGLITWLITLPLRLDRTLVSAILIVVMFANGGNYGLPLTLFAFGQEALVSATIYFVTSAILTYTVGIFLASSGRTSVREALVGMFKVPVVYAVATAAIVMLTKTTLPALVMRPIKLLSDAAIPMMLLVLGMQLEQAVIPKRPWLVGLAATLRLIVAMLLALVLTPILGLSGAARQAGVIQAAMPTAVITTILAVEYKVDPTFVTGVVLVSTLLSPLTLTPLIALLR